MDTEHDHLAVATEDHPLAYARFSGTIPAGEYGGGQVSIWDHGTYECEKWTEREIKVVLHGQVVEGTFVLFPTKGSNWMIHRLDPPPGGFEPLPEGLSPMLATAGDIPTGRGWAYEFKWDGVRVLVRIDGGRARALSRNGHDLTASFPELRRLGEAMGSRQAILDGELVVLDEDGRPRFSRLQHRLQVVAAGNVKRAAARDPAGLILFDLLHLDGRSLLDSTYDDRRRLLESLELAGSEWAVTPSFTEESGDEVLKTAARIGMEGVVAKRRSSPYRPGKRSHDWIKTKTQRTQEVVIGGWTPGRGNRRDLFGSLLLGIPDRNDGDALEYVGKVGTGFSRDAMDALLGSLGRIARKRSPFGRPLPRDVGTAMTWVRPVIVGEVRFSEWTPDGRLRHPVWRGLRPDKSAGEVVRES
jgi:bifunctional non-homologous end joining protein LigD